MKEFMICDNIKNITRANHTEKAICVQDEHLMSQHAPNMTVTTAHRPQDDPCWGVCKYAMVGGAAGSTGYYKWHW
jgi:hypothetical protein